MTLALSALIGCGRIGFDTGFSTDARSDATDTLVDGPATFGPWLTPVEVLAMQTDAMEFGPTFSPNTNEVFVAQRFTGEADIYRYTRPDPASAFTGRTSVTPLNVIGSEDADPSLGDDGLTIYIDRFAPERVATSTRSALGASDWSAPVLFEAMHPALAGFRSPDFAGDLRMVVSGGGMIWESTRPTPSSSWGAPVSLGIAGDYPCMRRDGLELLWEGRVMIGGNASLAMFRATRPSVDDAFGSAERLSFGALDVAGVGDPELSHDGRTLIFSAEEVPGRGTYDIYISERTVE